MIHNGASSACDRSSFLARSALHDQKGVLTPVGMNFVCYVLISPNEITRHGPLASPQQIRAKSTSTSLTPKISISASSSAAVRSLHGTVTVDEALRTMGSLQPRDICK
jgi:hypothetical protein